MIFSWPTSLPLFSPYNFLTVRWRCDVLSSNKHHEFCFCFRVLISPLPCCLYWYLPVTSFGSLDILSDDDLLISSWYWGKCRRRATKMIKGQRDCLRGKMRRTRCCYLLVEWSKKTIETTCKHLRAVMIVRDGKKKNGDRERQENILCV